MRKNILVSTLLVILLALPSWGIWQILKTQELRNPSTENVLILEPNSSAIGFINSLEKIIILRYPKLLLFWIKLNKLEHNLKAGIYEIQSKDSLYTILQKVSQGKVIIKNFIIVEGTNLKQLIDKLSTAPYLNFNLNDLTIFKSTYLNAEGLFLADTYQYTAGSKAANFLSAANQKLMDHLNKTWLQRNPIVPYKTPYELLIAASIIEKEAANLEERKIISGILSNRLKLNMPLQMDPTVVYALGTDYHGKLTHNDMHINSPYNTYIRRGLPPTPIAMVGKQAIEIAANPTLTSYLYFVARDGKSHIFSETYAEHRQAVATIFAREKK